MRFFRPSMLKVLVFIILLFAINQLPSCFQGFPDGDAPFPCGRPITPAGFFSSIIGFLSYPLITIVLLIPVVLEILVVYVVSCALVVGYTKLTKQHKRI